MTNLQHTLWKIHGILEKYGYQGEAEYIMKVMDSLSGRHTAWRELLSSDRIWGGAGAVWEVGHLDEDTLLYWNLFLELAQETEASGVDSEKIRNVREILRNNVQLMLDQPARFQE